MLVIIQKIQKKDFFLPVLKEYRALIANQVTSRDKSPFLSKLENATEKPVEGVGFEVSNFLQKLPIEILSELQNELPDDKYIQQELKKRENESKAKNLKKY
jgi:hypothetical protein